MFLTKNVSCGSTLFALILASGVLLAAGPKQIPEVDVNVVNTPLPVTVQESQPREAVLIKSYRVREFTSNNSTLLVGDGGFFSVCVGAKPDCEDGTGRYTVPSDKQLVIKHISFRARSVFPSVTPEPVGASVKAFFEDANGVPWSWDFQFGLLDVKEPLTNVSGKGFQTDITLPPGTEFAPRLDWAKSFTGNVEGEFSIAGEFINAP